MMPHLLQLILLQAQQAITKEGAISADWVLVAIAGIALLLGVRILNRIEKNQETLTVMVNSHETKIELNEQSIESIRDQIRDLKPARG